MNRAYSVIHTKAFDDTKRTFTGIASTPRPDRDKDVMVMEGAEFKLPMPLLLHHKGELPVGRVTAAKVTPDGIEVEFELPEVEEEGELKKRVDEAWHSLKYQLITALSIGFQPDFKEAERLKDGGFKFNKWDWFELSLVTIPANAEATINLVKSIDSEQRAALGIKDSDEQDNTDPPVGDTTTKHLIVQLSAPKQAGVKLS